VATGTHTLSVAGYRGGTGTYRLSAATNPLAGAAVANDPLYYQWPVTTVGSVVRDASSAEFRVRVADGVVVDATGVAFPELTVNTSTRAVTKAGQAIGYVGYFQGATGRFGLPLLYCTDKQPHANHASQQRVESPLRLGWWGGATAVGSGTDATTGASFVTWSDAANADVVLGRSRYLVPLLQRAKFFWQWRLSVQQRHGCALSRLLPLGRLPNLLQQPDLHGVQSRRQVGRVHDGLADVRWIPRRNSHQHHGSSRCGIG
jgi:hypothetical protein